MVHLKNCLKSVLSISYRQDSIGLEKSIFWCNGILFLLRQKQPFLHMPFGSSNNWFFLVHNYQGLLCCPLCGGGPEDCSHLFFQCPLAQEAWRGAAVARLSVTSEETFWNSLLGGSFRREADWRRIFATLWAIWIHRNEVIFRGISPSGDAITHTAEGFYFSWHRGGIGPSNLISLL